MTAASVEKLPEVLAPGDIAKLFRVDTRTVTRWAKNGKIRSFRTPGGHRRFYRDDVLALLPR